MKINLICFGKLKTPGLDESEAFFEKRIKPWAKMSIHQLRANKVDHPSEIPEALNKDAELIQKALKDTKSQNVYLLLDTGKNLETSEWAKTLETTDGEITFIIGGSYGMSAELRKRYKNHISFGQQTLSQGVARIVFLEQLYRSLSVINHHPYHHG